MTYDLIIIGAGPGGYSAALNGSKNGLKTLLIEKDKLGGICLNEGCIPTKTLLYSSKIYDNIQNGEKYGITAENIKLDHERILARKNKVIKTISMGIKTSLQNNNVTYINSSAKIIKDENGNLKVSAALDNTIYSSKNIIIATGSSPILPKIKGVEEMYSQGFLLTSREILEIPKPPKSLAIIGSGAVGLEMASYFSSAGAEVTVIEMLPKICGNLDKDLSDNLLKNLRKKGINFLLGSKLMEVKNNSIIYEENGETKELNCEKALISIGRSANIFDLGLEEAGIAFEKNAIATNDFCETNIKGVYAIGDVNGKLMLAHTAYREADVCINNILGKPDKIDYTNIPSVIYTNPEVASVGETEESAKQKAYDCKAVNISMRYSGRYLAENEGGDGICKVIIDKSNSRVLGVHMVANYATEIIYGAEIIIQNKTEIDSCKKIVFPHPSVSEIIREALLEIKL